MLVQPVGRRTFELIVMDIQTGNIVKFNSMDIRTLEPIAPEIGLVVKVEPAVPHSFMMVFAHVLLSDGVVMEFAFQEGEVEVIG